MFMAHLGDLSGANRSLVDLVTSLKSQGIEPFVIVPRKGALTNKLMEINVKYKCIPSATWVGHKKKESIVKKIIKQTLNYLAEFKMYRFFHKYRESIDIVHFNSMVYGCGAIALKKLKIPFVWHIREFPEETFGLYFYNKNKTLEIINNSERVIGISNSIVDNFTKYFNEMELVYNGVEVGDKIHKEPIIRDELKPLYLIAGAVAPDKGQLVAVQAIAKLVNDYHIDAHLDIVGGVIDQKYFDKLNRVIEVNKIQNNVTFHGYLNDYQVLRKKNNFALMCSSNEAFGRVTIEAMISNQLLIGANSGGTAEIIQHMHNGLLYEVDDVAGLVEKMIFSLNNRTTALNLINKGRLDAIEKFDINRTAREVIRIYKKVR
ncbi:glycosyltransferase family 4 protein [Priestia megaterium]|uniref:glycosyltransferase family 4 protein n=1 Tax=Priestia megaterium TaxID=1404 RepID=UPI00221EE9A2|nr:glycosyltransferase family 4 protein [Priestia megaterium]